MNDIESSPAGHSAARRSIAVWLATAGGVGWIPVAPGTFGSILGIPLALALARLENPWGAALALAAVAAAGVFVCAVALRRLGNPHDPGYIVLDEVVGMAATLFLAEHFGMTSIIAGFLLFRLFDVMKPPPIRLIERLPGAWGVMADDLMAALYANLSLQGLLWFVAWGTRKGAGGG